MGAYIQLNKQGQKDSLDLHNSTGERAQYVAQFLFRLFGSYLSKSSRVLDVGCGSGFITNEVNLLLVSKSSTIKGIDASENAIEFASNKWPGIQWEAAGVDENFVQPDQFDVIYAWEFYPFSRTNDWNYQKGIIAALKKILKKDGLLIIANLPLEHSIFLNLNKMTSASEVQDLKKIGQHNLPPFKLWKMTGSYFGSSILARIFGKKMVSALIYRKV